MSVTFAAFHASVRQSKVESQSIVGKADLQPAAWPLCVRSCMVTTALWSLVYGCHQTYPTQVAECGELGTVKHACYLLFQVHTGAECHAKCLLHFCYILYVLQATLEELIRCPNSNVDFQPIPLGSRSRGSC